MIRNSWISRPYARLRQSFKYSRALALCTPFLLAVLPTGVAHAASGIGICDSHLSNSYCWRQVSGGGTDLWSRDISGDVNQQYTAVYDGTVSAEQCQVPGFSSWNNYGVYEFRDHAGYDIGAQSRYVGQDPGLGGSSYDQWIWLPSGQIVNCQQSQNDGTPMYLVTNGNYHQLTIFAGGSSDTYAQVHGT